MLGHVKIISLVLAVNVIAGGTFAFGQNAIAERAASYKANLVPGYDATGILFDLDDADPTVVDTITFKITPSHGSTQANYAKIQTETDGIWTECSLEDDVLPTRRVTCTFESLVSEDVTALNIVAK
jgi:hypothetical protein